MLNHSHVQEVNWTMQPVAIEMESQAQGHFAGEIQNSLLDRHPWDIQIWINKPR